MDAFVIDTSVLFKALFLEGELQEEGRQRALNLFDRAQYGEVYLMAPSLIWYELNNCFVINGVSLESTAFEMDVLRHQVDNGLIEIFPPTKELLEKSA
jgi:hypothetical protein